MAETKCIILELRPPMKAARKERMYRESAVKKILLGFAHDIGSEWSDEQLQNFIEDVFDFD